MPDLKTELMKLDNLKFDDDAQPQTQEVIVHTTDDKPTSLMEVIWQHIKANPAANYKEICKAIGKSQSDVSTRLTQMYHSGKLTRNAKDGIYQWYVAGDNYNKHVRGLKTDVRKSKVARKVKTTPKAKAPRVEAKYPTKYDANELLSTMSIVEARALYDKLKELFGG